MKILIFASKFLAVEKFILWEAHFTRFKGGRKFSKVFLYEGNGLLERTEKNKDGGLNFIFSHTFKNFHAMRIRERLASYTPRINQIPGGTHREKYNLLFYNGC